MKLEQQVCNLDLAKRLEELGVKQGSLFHWAQYETSREWDIFWDIEKSRHVDLSTAISAFTVAELGDMLPNELTKGGWDEWNNHLEIRMLIGEESAEWVVEYGAGDAFATATKAKTEADSRAKMLIYLLENKLITL